MRTHLFAILLGIASPVIASDMPDPGLSDSLVIQAASLQLMDYSRALLQSLETTPVPAGGGQITITYQGETVPVQVAVVLVPHGESIHVTPTPYIGAPFDDLHLLMNGAAGSPMIIAAVTASTTDGVHLSGYTGEQGALSISYHSSVTQGSQVIAATDQPTLGHRTVITAAPPAASGSAPSEPEQTREISLVLPPPYIPADTSPVQTPISKEAP